MAPGTDLSMIEGASAMTSGAGSTATLSGVVATVKKAAESKLGSTILATAKKIMGGGATSEAAPETIQGSMMQEGFFLHFLRMLLA